MLGWILGGLAVAALLTDDGSQNTYSDIREDNERLARENRALKEYNNSLRHENARLKLTIHNQQALLKNYDYVNRTAKSIGYGGAVSLFYYLAEYHDSRFSHFARFLNKVRLIRNDVAHNGTVYEIDQGFLNKLDICKRICDAYMSLPAGRCLYLN